MSNTMAAITIRQKLYEYIRYGNQVEDYEIEILEDIYKIQGVDYEEKGVLTQNEFKEILNCIINSSSTKRKIKKFLKNIS